MSDNLFAFRIVDEAGRLYKGTVDKKTQRGRVHMIDEDNNTIRGEAPMPPHVSCSIMSTCMAIRHEIMTQALLKAQPSQHALEAAMALNGGPTHVLPVRRV